MSEVPPLHTTAQPFLPTTLDEWSAVAFSAVIIVISILSFWQAKKSLFSPIRTETFKAQLKLFERITSLLQDKDELGLRRHFDLDRIIFLNSGQMISSYAYTKFSIKGFVDESMFTPLEFHWMSHEFAEKVIDWPSPSKEIQVTEEKSQPSRSFSPLAPEAWSDYEHGTVGATEKFQGALAELKDIQASPLIPKSIREHLKDLEDAVIECIHCVGTTLTRIAPELERSFKSPEDLKRISESWVANEYNDDSPPLHPKAKAILDSIAGYLSIDKLMK